MTSAAPAADILLMAGDAQGRRELEGHLLGAGHAVHLAEDGPRALGAFAARPFDLVLLAIPSQGSDGFEICRRLRALPRGEEVPIVVVTARPDPAAYAQALAAGADDLLAGPGDPIALLLRVRSLLRIRRLCEEVRQGRERLRAERDELRRLLQWRQRLSAFVVHDLTNPLAAILVNCQILSAAPALPEEAREDARHILLSAEAMQRLVRDLFDIGRSEDGDLIARRDEVDLPALVAEVRVQMRWRLEENQQRLLDSYAAGLRPIVADRDLLRRVLENLLENAIRHAPSGTAIAIAAGPAGDDAVELRVKDEGPGIAAAHREEIFDLYAHADAIAAPRPHRSQALGLRFCRLAVEAQGGRIWVEGPEGRGCCLCVSLPAGPGATTSPRGAPGPAARTGSPGGDRSRRP